jgi:UDP-N-acetylmuramate dehydrogenase
MFFAENYPLLEHNTFHLDVEARWFAEYESETDLQGLLSNDVFRSNRRLHIGRGSNLLFLCDYEGMIVHSRIRAVEVVRHDPIHVWVRAGAGAGWDRLVSYSVRRGWGGLENLSAIPGEVGGSVIQNIGAYGVEVGNRVEEVHTRRVPTGEKRVFLHDECRFDYRHSVFKEEEMQGLYYVTHVVFRLDRYPEFKTDYGDLAAQLGEGELSLKAVREAVIALRKDRLPDPAFTGNAGSFFKNPLVDAARCEVLRARYPELPVFPAPDGRVKLSAAWMIDRCGLKGHRLDGAAVSRRHPLVLINTGSATGADVACLAEEVADAVRDRFGVELQREVIYV